MKNKGGRPGKLSNEIKQVLINGVLNGLTLKASCKLAGISYSTFASWRVRGRLAKVGECDEYKQLMDSINSAISQIVSERRATHRANLKSRDWRHGWKNSMKDETKQKLRQIAFEKAFEAIVWRYL